MKSSHAASVTSISSGSLATRLDRVRSHDAAPSPMWEPTGPAAQPAAPIAIPGEAAMIAVIRGPLAAGEGHQDGNARKERDLMALFDALSPVQALTVRRRLSAMRAGDPLVAAFARLVVERRGRLLAFLDDTRRRHALR